MKLLKTKVWSWLDIALLKWSCLLLGGAAGAYFAEIVRPNSLLLLAVAMALAVKPALGYFRDRG